MQRNGRASRTAMLVSAWRGLGKFDRASVSHDPIARELVGVPYRTVLDVADRNPRAARALFGMASALSGGLARHLPLRTRAIDDALEAEVGRGTNQIVLLGAGLDARAHRLLSLASCTVFEVDHPDTQAHKREVVRGLPRHARDVRYVAVDFEKDDLESALKTAGHDRSAPSVTVWEGVTMYLERGAVEATVTTLSRLSPSGSVLLVTYYDVVGPPGAALVRPLFRIMGEPLKTRFSRGEMRALLGPRGFEVIKDEGDEEWGERYLGKRGLLSMSERLATAQMGTAESVRV